MAEDDDSVNIRIKRDTWERLHGEKGPGDSFDDVIREMLREERGESEGNRRTPTATAD